MKKLILTLTLLAICVARFPAFAADEAPALKDPTTEQRIGDLEAYINNVGRAADTPDNKVKSNIAAPGPGHNAWLMTSSALVLFMTLPGLALF